MTTEEPRINRRSVLKASALAAAVGMVLGLESEDSDADWDTDLVGGQVQPQLRITPSFVKSIRRRADQLSLRLEFYNLKLIRKGYPGPGTQTQDRLVRQTRNLAAYIVVDFGPQHLAEKAYLEDSSPPLTSAVPTSLAGATRLAFQVPTQQEEVAYTFGSLMAWDKLESSVVWNAQDYRLPSEYGTLPLAPNKAPTEPLPVQTSIEVPWRVHLSPSSAATWQHGENPDPNAPEDTRIPLWTTSLQPVDGKKTVRAVWSPDHANPQQPTPPVRTSLNGQDRKSLVMLSSQWHQKVPADNAVPEHDYKPLPVKVDQLMLSPLGAWLKSRGDWLEKPGGTSLEKWTHLATMGRDHFAELCYAGRLWPLRHRALLYKVTTRRIEVLGDKPTAFLRQRFFIVLRDHEIGYGPNEFPHMPKGGREMPFKKIRIRTEVTPSLATMETVAQGGAGTVADPLTKIYTKWLTFPNGSPDMTPSAEFAGNTAFWPVVIGGTVPFGFECEGTDYEGRVSRFSMPLIFVDDRITATSGQAHNYLYHYYDHATATPDSHRDVQLHEQRVALAIFDNGEPGETAYPIQTLTFSTEILPLEATVSGGVGTRDTSVARNNFFPRLRYANVRLDAVDRLRGPSGSGGGGSHRIFLHDAWVKNLPNGGLVFARLETAADLSFPANSSGGVATPNLKITALSALTGPMGGATANATAPQKFLPDQFFGNGAAPKILGTIPLDGILQSLSFPERNGIMALSGSDYSELSGSDGGLPVPRMVNTEIPGGMRTSLTWTTDKLQNYTLPGMSTPVFVPDVAENGKPPGILELTAETLTYVDGRPAETSISGRLSNFTVPAVGDIHVIDLAFDRFGFISRNGQKPDVDVAIRNVAFVGPLEFVNTLRKYLSDTGIGSGGGGPATGLAKAAASDSGGGFIDVTPSGIAAGYTLGIPPVSVGAFLLENINISARLEIPFDGRPARVRFAFAEREQPFTLTVMCFGGGGFLAVTLGLDEFELFEMSLEFGAKLSLNVGVASGSVSAMAGIYLAIGDRNGDGVSDGCKLTGYLRLRGELDIMGLISICLEFYLAFNYDNGRVWGEATLYVEVDVLIFSATVKVGPVKKEFAGGGGSAGLNAAASAQSLAAGSPPPPSFMDTFQHLDWTDYAEMFATAAFPA